MTEPSNIRILSDDDAQSLLPVLARVGAIVEDSRSVIAHGGTVRPRASAIHSLFASARAPEISSSGRK